LALHLQPCFEYLGQRPGSFPESERAAGEVLSLPIFPELEESELEEVASAIEEFFERER
jgi:dTDP-4-amino-4,6-dideoxygalactose transaminase